MEESNNSSECFTLNYPVVNLSDEIAADERLWTEIEDLFFTIGLPIIMLIGSVGNFAFIFTVFRVKAMQTVTNAYLTNVAIADFVFIGFTCPTYLVSYLKTPVRNDFLFPSVIGCAGSFGLSYFGYFASLLLITIVTAERYYAICRPFQHRMIAGKKHTIRMIVTSWLLAILLVGCVMPEYAKLDIQCIIWPDKPRYDNFPKLITFCDPINTNLYILGELVLTCPFFLAMPANLFMYISIIITLNNRPGTESSSENQQNKSTRNQVARLLIINGSVFFLCQAPYRFVSMHLITRQISGEGFLSEAVYGITILISRGLILLNSCCNPLIYLATSSFYRQAFWDAFFGEKPKSKMATSVNLSTVAST